MKLLQVFNEKIGSMGKIERIWFTTFNLSIDFFETHVLPIVVAQEKPKVRQDYEQMQYEVNEKNIDIRIFSDRRMIRTTDIKRTAVPVYGVANDSLNDEFLAGGLFHPKVIFIQDDRGKMWLGAGSANLTLSGWGRNQEVFSFRRVSTVEQVKQIRSFFDPLFEFYCQQEPGYKLPRDNLGDDENWNFIHSFMPDKFTDHFSKEEKLSIWSPYFSGDISGFHNGLKEALDVDELDLRLVPDLVEGKHIRSKWNASLGKKIESGGIDFCKNPIPPHDNTELNHGKLWVGSKAIALGSWNCTRTGANLLDTANNVEAGFIFDRNELKSLHPLESLKVDKSWFLSDDKFEAEALKLEDDLPFDIKVIFDWETQAYEIEGAWLRLSKNIYHLLLPDIEQPFEIEPRAKKPRKIEGILSVSDPRYILANHYVDIRLGDDSIGRVVILEINVERRRVQGFETIDELLDSFISKSDPAVGIGSCLREELLVEETSDDLEKSLADESNSVISSYFRLFQATDAYAERLESYKYLADLEKQVFTYPGCLVELREKLATKTDKNSDVYRWFLLNEYNRLVKTARNALGAFYKKDVKPIIKKWHGLELPDPALPESVSKEYVALIQQECRYE